MNERASSAPATPGLQPAVRDHLGDLLSQLMVPATADLPPDLAGLVEDLTHAFARYGVHREEVFRRDLNAALPKLRGFALSLTRRPDRADDLIQDTVMRALRAVDKFKPGSNMEAWLFTIMRNHLMSEYRRQQREVEDPEGKHASKLGVLPEQGARLGHQDLLIALTKLTPSHRKALLLVGAQGLTYEETAEVCGVPVGTIKSRVNRARLRLAALLGEDGSFGFDGITTAAIGTDARE